MTLFSPNLRTVRRGFSLLELLAVVTILGVLATLILYRTTRAVEDAKVKVQVHQMSEINTAVEHYYMTHQTWPTSLADLVPDQFPDGIPDPPTGGTYGLDPVTHRAVVQ